MKRVRLAAGLGLALALVGAATQSGPMGLQDRTDAVVEDQRTVLVYLVADLKTNEVLVGPYVISMSELPKGAGHGCEETFGHRITPDAAEETDCTVRCRAIRASADHVELFASVSLAGSSNAAATQLGVKGRGCDVVPLKGRDQGRFVLVSAVCDPVCRQPAAAPGAARPMNVPVGLPSVAGPVGPAPTYPAAEP